MQPPPGPPEGSSGTSTLECPKCAGTVPFERYDPRLTCPYCAHCWELTRDELGRLGRHNARVRSALFRTDDARAHRARRRFYHGGKERSPRVTLAFAVGSVAVLFGTMFALLRLGLSPDTLDWLVPVVLFATFFLVVAISFSLFYESPEAPRATELAPSSVRCGDCGGVQELAAGELFGRCHFCGAALLPGNTMMGKVEEEASRAARRAEDDEA